MVSTRCLTCLRYLAADTDDDDDAVNDDAAAGVDAATGDEDNDDDDNDGCSGTSFADDDDDANDNDSDDDDDNDDDDGVVSLSLESRDWRRISAVAPTRCFFVIFCLCDETIPGGNLRPKAPPEDTALTPLRPPRPPLEPSLPGFDPDAFALLALPLPSCRSL